MKKKLFIAIYTFGIVLTITLLSIVVTSISKQDVVPPTAEEVADVSIAQLAERPNSSAPTHVSPPSNPITTLLYPRAEPLSSGCSLRFAYEPLVKAVEPGGNIEYAIKISNGGNEVCKNVSLSVYYTDKETFVSSHPVPTASDYYWAIGDLSSRGVYNLSLTTKTPAGNQEDIMSEACSTADNSADVCAQKVIFTQEGASKITTLSSAPHVPLPTGSVWGKNFTNREFGIWVWDSINKMTPAYAKDVISTAEKNGFNVIYLTVDDYITIAQAKDSTIKTQEEDAYMRSLSGFIQAAASSGIKVDVVGGAKDWAIEANRWKGYALIDFVNEYNTKYPQAKIRNLQYDVEPYLLSDYEGDKQKILKEYIEFIDESARRMQAMTAGFVVVIPHFYDNQQNWTPAYTYKGKEADTFTHLLDVLSQKQKTGIIIMAYRNFFEGANGTQQISAAEIKEASNSSYSTKIIVAQETGNVSPDYVTFNNFPKAALFDALVEIQNHFGGYPSFGGVAVHYFDSFLKLQ